MVPYIKYPLHNYGRKILCPPARHMVSPVRQVHFTDKVYCGMALKTPLQQRNCVIMTSSRTCKVECTGCLNVACVGSEQSFNDSWIVLPACKLTFIFTFTCKPTFIFSTEKVSSLSNRQHVNMNTCTSLIPRLSANS